MKINGEMRYLWRAVDHEGEVLESLVTITRDKAADVVAICQLAVRRHDNAAGLGPAARRSQP